MIRPVLAALALWVALASSAAAQTAPRPMVLALTARTAAAWPIYVAIQVGFFAANGIKPDIVIAGSSTAGVAELMAGSADIADVSAVQIAEAIVGGAPVTSIFDRGGFGPSILPLQKDVIPVTQLTYAVNTTWAKTHADLVVAFLNAHVQSVQWLYDSSNRSRAIDILARETNAAPEDAAKLYDAYVTKFKFYTLNGTTSRDRVRLALAALVRAKHIITVPAALDVFYDNRYVAAVNTHLKIR